MEIDGIYVIISTICFIYKYTLIVKEKDYQLCNVISSF